jgi:hypothetical protein
MQLLEVEVPTALTVLSDQAQGAARAAQSNGGLACMCSGQELDTKQAWPDFNSCSPQDTVIMASWGSLGHEWAAALSISACFSPKEKQPLAAHVWTLWQCTEP